RLDHLRTGRTGSVLEYLARASQLGPANLFGLQAHRDLVARNGMAFRTLQSPPALCARPRRDCIQACPERRSAGTPAALRSRGGSTCSLFADPIGCVLSGVDEPRWVHATPDARG